MRLLKSLRWYKCYSNRQPQIRLLKNSKPEHLYPFHTGIWSAVVVTEQQLWLTAQGLCTCGWKACLLAILLTRRGQAPPPCTGGSDGGNVGAISADFLVESDHMERETRASWPFKLQPLALIWPWIISFLLNTTLFPLASKKMNIFVFPLPIFNI